MPIHLTALALQNYRGIGGTTQKMVNFKTFNFFIGANNVGKSTVLNFISRHLPPRITGGSIPGPAHRIEPLEYHTHAAGSPIYMALGSTLEEAWKHISQRHRRILQDPQLQTNLQTVLRALVDADGMLWSGSRVPYEKALRLEMPNPQALASVLQRQEWHDLWSPFANATGGDMLQDWIPTILNIIDGSLNASLPRTRIIPAIRQIGPKGASFEDYSGIGLIDQLGSIQNPEHDRRADRSKFDRINGFLRFVTGKSDAEIEIPYSREHILVHMDTRVLPLASLGTGIQEVIMIAAFCTLAENEIVCIEEPELHLHPLLQRKLISYLASNTSNQYFIATHSAAFIDTPEAAIFHVTLEDNTTHIQEAALRQDRFAICVDLGHRASDILQSNAVLWVEGPSDRIYLEHWISILAPELVEGIHYSIMFYGGRLLSHLSANDDEVSEFIQLRSLNRNLGIIMDSDKINSKSPINATKQRIYDEFQQPGSVAWITAGREIENYVDHARLQRAVKMVYENIYSGPLSSSSYAHALHFKRNSPKKKRDGNASASLIETEVDKVKVSRAVVEDGNNSLNVLDLNDRVSEIVEMIRAANA